jgi:hypothetical protein
MSTAYRRTVGLGWIKVTLLSVFTDVSQCEQTTVPLAVWMVALPHSGQTWVGIRQLLGSAHGAERTSLSFFRFARDSGQM